MRQPPDRRQSGPQGTTPTDRSNTEAFAISSDTDTVIRAADAGPLVPRQHDPVSLAGAIGELLELSDECDSWMHRILAAGREGYARGLAAGVELGRRLEAAERDRAWNEIARPISRIDPGFMSRRWAVRGEPRMREAFGQPHPGDFQGRKGAA